MANLSISNILQNNVADVYIKWKKIKSKLVSDDVLYDWKAFYKVKNHLHLLFMNDSEFINC